MIQVEESKLLKAIKELEDELEELRNAGERENPQSKKNSLPTLVININKARLNDDGGE